MAIINHIDVLAPQTFSGDAASVAQTKLNSNFTLAETEAQKIEERVEHLGSSLVGEGFLTLPTIASSTGSLQITVGACTVCIGVYLSYAGGQVTLLASQAAGTLYLQNDLTFSTTLPTTKSYMTFGTYVTTGSGVTSFTLASGMLLPKLVTVTGTVSNIYVPDDVDYAEAYIDHSATATFAVDGCLKMTVSDTDAFTVEELYPGGMIHADSNFLNSPLHQRTNEGFWYRITRRAAYSYAAKSTVSLTYVRTGVCVST